MGANHIFAHSLDATLVETLSAPHIGYYRDLHVGELANGLWVAVAFGYAYVPRYSVWVYGDSREPLYQETGLGSAFGFHIPSDGSSRFLLGAGNKLLEYHVN